LILVIGPVLTFFEAYNLYFLAGRYPLLGEILEPPFPTAGMSPLPNYPPPMPPVF
jgi:hypothetical protein